MPGCRTGGGGQTRYGGPIPAYPVSHLPSTARGVATPTSQRPREWLADPSHSIVVLRSPRVGMESSSPICKSFLSPLQGAALGRQNQGC
jgi:hypothetical protein